MNKQAMVNMMAKRLNLSPDETVALQNGDYRRIAQTRFADDPMMMSMLDMFEQRRATPSEPIDMEPARKPRRSFVDDDEVAELEGALKAAQTSMRYLAQIFGACRCWGKNDDCLRCGGDGAPGWRPSSDPQLLLGWVQPAVRALGYELVPTARRGAVAPSSPVKHETKEETQ